MSYRILVVADHPEALCALIDGAPDLAVCCKAATAQAALVFLEVSQPDLVLAETTRPEPDGLKLTERIRAAYPDVPVLVVAPPEEDIHAARVLRAGAQGAISVPSSGDAILAAIRSALVGHVVLPDSAREQILSSPPPTGTPPASADGLSDRQLEVLRLIGQGMTTTEIAEALGISPKTVETHRLHIKSKLNLETANALIHWATLWAETDGRHDA